jgi:hypothetical protein
VWIWKGLGLMIGFVRLFDTASNYTLQFTITHAHTHTHTHTSVHSHVFITRCSVAASNNGDSLSSGSRTVAGVSYQLLTATACNDWTSAVLWLTDWLTDWLTKSLTHQLTQLNWLTLSSLTLPLITPRQGPHRKYRSIIAVYRPLPSNDNCLAVCFGVVF